MNCHERSSDSQLVADVPDMLNVDFQSLYTSKISYGELRWVVGGGGYQPITGAVVFEVLVRVMVSDRDCYYTAIT